MDAKIKYLKDETGTKISPITSYKSLVNDNGSIIENKLVCVRDIFKNIDGTNKTITFTNYSQTWAEQHTFYLNISYMLESFDGNTRKTTGPIFCDTTKHKTFNILLEMIRPAINTQYMDSTCIQLFAQEYSVDLGTGKMTPKDCLTYRIFSDRIEQKYTLTTAANSFLLVTDVNLYYEF